MDLNGHAAVGFVHAPGDGPPIVKGVFGFYPSGIKDDSESGFDTGRIYRVSPEDFNRMMGEALRREKMPGKYDRTKRNCTTFVKDVGEKGDMLGGVTPIPLSGIDGFADFGKSEKPTYVPGALGDFLKGDDQPDSFLYPECFDDE